MAEIAPVWLVSLYGCNAALARFRSMILSDFALRSARGIFAANLRRRGL